MSAESTEAGMCYDEVHAVVKRYHSEGDALTVFGMLRALDAVKADMLDNLKRHHDKDSDSSEKV